TAWSLCRLIPIKRVPSRLRNLAVAWSGEEDGNMSRQPEKPSNVKAKHGLHRKTRRKKMGLENRPVLEPNAAGIDIGAREIFVAVPPGRRTDWHECQWLQYLHSVGLLRGAFRPEA